MHIHCTHHDSATNTTIEIGEKLLFNIVVHIFMWNIFTYLQIRSLAGNSWRNVVSSRPRVRFLRLGTSRERRKHHLVHGSTSDQRVACWRVQGVPGRCSPFECILRWSQYQHRSRRSGSLELVERKWDRNRRDGWCPSALWRIQIRTMGTDTSTRRGIVPEARRAWQLRVAVLVYDVRRWLPAAMLSPDCCLRHLLCYLVAVKWRLPITVRSSQFSTLWKLL